MIFKNKGHNNDLYNTLLSLSRNIFFYKEMKFIDNFETRIYLMFIHFSIMMIVFKKKGQQFDQKSYDSLFFNIENNLRELGFGDVSVNKKMKEFNNILYDILLKINMNNISKDEFKINYKLAKKYFVDLKDPKSTEFLHFNSYFLSFFNYCFEIPLDIMVRNAINFKY